MFLIPPKLSEREVNSAGLEYTTRLHESRKPSILNAFFTILTETLFFVQQCLGFLKKTSIKRLLRGACSGKKSCRARRSENNKKIYTHRDLNTDDGEKKEKSSTTFDVERARREQEKRRLCRCVVVAGSDAHS